MSTDYYMVCPQCKRYALIFRYTASGFNPPNSLKVHHFFLNHSTHDDFKTAVHEDDELLSQAVREEWQDFDTYGEGWEAKPFPREGAG